MNLVENQHPPRNGCFGWMIFTPSEGRGCELAEYIYVFSMYAHGGVINIGRHDPYIYGNCPPTRSDIQLTDLPLPALLAALVVELGVEGLQQRRPLSMPRLGLLRLYQFRSEQRLTSLCAPRRRLRRRLNARRDGRLPPHTPSAQVYRVGRLGRAWVRVRVGVGVRVRIIRLGLACRGKVSLACLFGLLCQQVACPVGTVRRDDLLDRRQAEPRKYA